mmetsp:Transcript_1836/g.3821  ORF Transcript_1836/g.3821 Transcript_1836/m.3821 type:complete len:604 (-) Transcript_1836:62-1873(-)
MGGTTTSKCSTACLTSSDSEAGVVSGTTTSVGFPVPAVSALMCVSPGIEVLRVVAGGMPRRLGSLMNVLRVMFVSAGVSHDESVSGSDSSLSLLVVSDAMDSPRKAESSSLLSPSAFEATPCPTLDGLANRSPESDWRCSTSRAGCCTGSGRCGAKPAPALARASTDAECLLGLRAGTVAVDAKLASLSNDFLISASPEEPKLLMRARGFAEPPPSSDKRRCRLASFFLPGGSRFGIMVSGMVGSDTRRRFLVEILGVPESAAAWFSGSSLASATCACAPLRSDRRRATRLGLGLGLAGRALPGSGPSSSLLFLLEYASMRCTRAAASLVSSVMPPPPGSERRRWIRFFLGLTAPLCSSSSRSPVSSCSLAVAAAVAAELMLLSAFTLTKLVRRARCTAGLVAPSLSMPWRSLASSFCRCVCLCWLYTMLSMRSLSRQISSLTAWKKRSRATSGCWWFTTWSCSIVTVAATMSGSDDTYTIPSRITCFSSVARLSRALPPMQAPMPYRSITSVDSSDSRRSSQPSSTTISATPSCPCINTSSSFSTARSLATLAKLRFWTWSHSTNMFDSEGSLVVASHMRLRVCSTSSGVGLDCRAFCMSSG